MPRRLWYAAPMRIFSPRMAWVLTRWLDIEAQRPPFKVIGTEVALTVNIEALTLNLRADRMDQLDTGEVILIDYKSR